jgi:cytochrome P450
MAATVSRGTFPPSVPPDLIGGHFRSFRKDPTGFLTRLSTLGDIAYFRLGPQPAYFINHPDLIRDVLVVNAHKFHKGRALQRAKRLLGEGLLTAEGDSHLRRRRMIQPAFHKNRIASYAASMVELAEQMSDSWVDGELRDIDREMMHLTLQIVGKTLFGADVTDDTDEVGRAMTSIVKLFNYLLLPFSEWLEKIPLPQTRRFHGARDKLNEVIYRIINDRRRSAEDRGDLLSMLLLAQDEEDGRGLSDEQVRDEALTLFLAGHETTANALTWTWYLLSQNPEAEAKLHAEIDSVLGERESGIGERLSHNSRAAPGSSPFSRSRRPTLDDFSQLRYTEAVFAESMRLFPPAWTLGRLVVDEHELNGYRIPKGSLILASQYVMHRDPRFWQRPTEFLPERWEGLGVKEAGQRFIYFPFGGGVRRCIGEGFAWTEGILLLAVLARNWRLRLGPAQTIGLSPMITLRPKFGMRMDISKR